MSLLGACGSVVADGANGHAMGHKMRMTSRSGYTMIEIVMVMLVMGILAAVAAPRYSSSTARFREDRCRSQLCTSQGKDDRICF